MGSSKRILIAAGLGALALIAVVFLTTRYMLGHSFAAIEAAESRQSLQRVDQALQMELKQLRAVARDNGHWDVAFESVLNRNGRFATDSATHEGIDLIWLGDSQGRTVSAAGTRPQERGTLGELPQALTQTVQELAGQLLPDGASGTQVSLIRSDGGLMVIAGVRVLKSSHDGPSPGVLVLGRRLDAAMLHRLEETSQSPLHLVSLDPLLQPSLPLPVAVPAWLSRVRAQPGENVFVQTSDGKTLDSYLLLRDAAGTPVALLANSVSHAALVLGRRTITWIVLMLLVGVAVLMAALLTTVNRGWSARARVHRESISQQRRFSKLSRRDRLTGLPNRVYLLKILPRLLRRAAREQTRLAVLYIDLDNFKNVNDSLGHEAGDRLLAAVAHRLRTSVAAHDVVACMGADEFVVVANDLPDLEIANAIADRIRRALIVPLDLDGVPLFASPSIGISFFPEHGTEAEQLLKQADIALNHAKDRGRGNNQVFTPEMNVRLRERFSLERALRTALERNELYVEYQPSYDLQSLQPVSLEALVRWKTSDGTIIPPGRFIPVAEQSGLIVDVGEWVLRAVCLQLSEWQRQGVPLLPVSVNISVRQIEHTQLATLVSVLTEELQIDPGLLHFEITESAAMQNSQQHLSSLHALRDLGSRILIDDFGTGYSSLSYLKHLPADTLKIDRAFVRDMAVDANDAAIVRAIVAVAKSLGLQLVAEGIETAEQLQCLKELDCERGQGFYFSRPVSAEACRALLRELRSPVRLSDRRPRLLAPAG